MANDKHILTSAQLREAADWVTRVDAGLSDEVQEAFEAWLAADPRNKMAFGQQKETWNRLNNLARYSQTEAMLTRSAARAARHFQQRLFALVALAVVMIVSVYYWKGSFGVSTVPQLAERSSADDIIVHLPETRTLDDGSVVQLGPGARIAVNYSATTRRIKLESGEAHFQVMKNPERPFIVSVAGVEVRAIGTAFAVRTGEEQIRVLVTEGVVGIRGGGGLQQAEPTALATAPASTQVLISAVSEKQFSATSTTLSSEVMARALEWRVPILEFRNAKLSEVVLMLNKHIVGSSRRRFVIPEAEVRDLMVSGVIHADNTDTFVRLLETSFGLKSSQLPNRILLSKADKS